MIGGDAFLRVRVERGHELVVRGYQDEPYVRIDADGAVFENGARRRWPSTRTASAAERAPKAPTRLRRPNGGGSPGTAPTSGTTTGSTGWPPPLPPQLGGAEAGRSRTGPCPCWSTVPWSRCGASSSAGRRPRWRRGWPWPLVWPRVTVVAGWRRPIEGVAGVFTLVGLAATVTSLVAELAVPAAAGRQYSQVVVAALATACAGGRPGGPPEPLRLGAHRVGRGHPALWIGLRWGVLTHAVLPTSTGEAAQRAAVAAAVGAVMGALALGGRALLAPPAARPGAGWCRRAPIRPPRSGPEPRRRRQPCGACAEHRPDGQARPDGPRASRSARTRRSRPLEWPASVAEVGGASRSERQRLRSAAQ